MRTPHWLVASVVLLVAAQAVASGVTVSVKTFDGLALSFDGEGRIPAVELDAAALPATAAGGFFISEVLPSQTPLPFDGATRAATAVTGTVAQTAPDEVTVSADVATLGVRFKATVRGGAALKVNAELTNTRGGDRAFVVYLRLPVEAAGWSWQSGLGGRKTISANARTYDEFYWHQAYRTTTSASPVVAISNGTAGLAAVMPPEAPAIYRLSYQPSLGLQLEWEVGTAPEPMRFPNAARLEALVYRVNAGWAFRSALKRLYLLHPKLWVKRAQDGSWFYDDQALMGITQPEDFALRFAETYLWSNDYTRAHGIYTMKYVEPWNAHLERDPAGLQTWAQDSAANQTWALISKGEPRQVSAQGALLSGIIGRDGQYGGYSDPANFTDPEGTYRYVLNPDWELPNFLNFTAQYTDTGRVLNRAQAVEEYELFRQWGKLPSATDSYSGVYLDSSNSSGSGWAGWHLFNFRREHFGTTRAGLVFDPQSGKVALSQALSSLESVRHLADLTHERGGLIMANGGDDPFLYTTAALCDFASAGEHYTADFKRARAVRAALGNKPSSYLYNDSVTDTEFQHAMLYAIFPGGAGYEQNRAVYKKWAPLMQQVAAAGWEPLTYAAADQESVLVERYGKLSAGTLHFVVHREGGTGGPAKVTLDKASLGMGQDVTVAGKELVTGAGAALADSGDSLQVTLQLAPEQTAILSVTATAGTPGPTRGDALPAAPASPGDSESLPGVVDSPPADQAPGCTENCQPPASEPTEGGPSAPAAGADEPSDPTVAAVAGKLSCGGCSSGASTLGGLGLFGLSVLLRSRRRPG